MEDIWYAKEEYLIKELNSDESGIQQIMGRETIDGWEYAIVYWSWGKCLLITIFKNGKITNGFDPTI